VISHSALVKRAERWLLSHGCAFALTELVVIISSGEIPDAIGWNGPISTILVECKTSRADFLADQKKHFRRDLIWGLGRYRYYLCPKGMLQPEEMPKGWGLLWAYPKQVRKIKESEYFKDTEWQGGLKNEIKMLLSVIRRAYLRGLLPEICAPLVVSEGGSNAE